MLEGSATPAQIAAFVAGLRVKGESVDEMTGLVQALQSHAERLDVGVEVVDTCGTGGDRSGTINVSTFSALVVAGAGAAATARVGAEGDVGAGVWAAGAVGAGIWF